MEEMNNELKSMTHEMKDVEVPTLTLDPDERPAVNLFNEPAMESIHMSSMHQKNGIAAGAVDESMLSDEEKQQVENFVKQIDVTNIKMVNSYGTNVQTSITTLSASITSSVKTNKFGDIGQDLANLRVLIGGTTVSEKKGIFGFLQKSKQKIDYLISNFESAEANIKKIEKNLQHHRQVLIKDIYIFDQMYDQYLKYYKELTMYVIAGKKALQLARNTKLIELNEKAKFTQDQLDLQIYKDYEDACTRFEKRISDLEISRLLSIQVALQIRGLQNEKQKEADSLRSDIINTIPLWRNQMVVALGIEHSRRALDAQAAVTKMTNEMFRKNSEMLKQGAIDAAVASEKAIVDIETMRKVNADIITSINEVVKIHEEGSRRRLEAQEELVKLENDLKQALLEAGNRR